VADVCTPESAQAMTVARGLQSNGLFSMKIAD
jgi:hypothetical protein